MSIDKDKIIDKIKKLLKLGRNSDVKGEAENAIAAAMRLAAGIGLSVEEISPDEEDKAEKIEEHYSEIHKVSFERWEKKLASGLADALGCICLYCGQSGVYMCFSIVGTKNDVILFNWLYPYIKKQLHKLYKKDFENFSFKMSAKIRRSWFLGAVESVNRRAIEFFNSNATAEEQQKYALVVLNKKDQARKLVDEMGVKEARSVFQEIDAYAARMGKEAGQKVVMARPVESCEPNLQLCGE